MVAFVEENRESLSIQENGKKCKFINFDIINVSFKNFEWGGCVIGDR